MASVYLTLYIIFYKRITCGDTLLCQKKGHKDTKSISHQKQKKILKERNQEFQLKQNFIIIIYTWQIHRRHYHTLLYIMLYI